MSERTFVIDAPVAFQPAKIADYGFALSKEKKTPYIWIKFYFDKDALVGDHGEIVEITTEKYITDNTIKFLLETLKVFGWEGDDIDDLFDQKSPNYYDLRGKPCSLTVVMETFTTSKGVQKQKAIVQYINPSGSGQQEKPVELSEIKKISLGFKGKIISERQKLAEAEKVAALQDPTPAPFREKDKLAKKNGDGLPF